VEPTLSLSSASARGGRGTCTPWICSPESTKLLLYARRCSSSVSTMTPSQSKRIAIFGSARQAWLESRIAQPVKPVAARASRGRRLRRTGQRRRQYEVRAGASRAVGCLHNTRATRPTQRLAFLARGVLQLITLKPSVPLAGTHSSCWTRPQHAPRHGRRWPCAAWRSAAWRARSHRPEPVIRTVSPRSPTASRGKLAELNTRSRPPHDVASHGMVLRLEQGKSWAQSHP
jgi:hypothetical protein